MTLTLYLVRHGATAPNAQRRYPRADEDAPLSPEGRAVAAGLRLPLHAHAFTSPSLRARQTAELAGFPRAAVAPALAEARFGVMAGRTWAELEAQSGEEPRGWIDALGDPESDLGPPGGETGRAFHARIQNWLNSLPDGGEVIAFTHAGPLLAALRLCVGLRAAETTPGGVAVLKRAGGHWWLCELRTVQSPPPPAPLC